MRKNKMTLLHYATQRNIENTKSMSAIRKSLASNKRTQAIPKNK